MPSLLTSPFSIPPAALSAPATQAPEKWNSPDINLCIKTLGTFFGLLREMVRTEAAWMAGVPYWDAKQAVARHLLENATSAEALLLRLHELKAKSAERQQSADVTDLIRDLASAPHGDAWLRGLYGHLKPWLLQEISHYRRHSDALMDGPTHQILTVVEARLNQQIQWFNGFQPRYSAWEEADTSAWESYVASRLKGLDTSAGELVTPPAPPLPNGATSFEGVARIRRDRTFPLASQSPFGRSAKDFPAQRFLIFYNHSQEMQFAESLGAILYECEAMPWAFQFNLARHLADEVRHATMGETRLRQLGVELSQVPMLTQHYEFRANLDPLERFCLMTLVMEATAFERKRANVELFESHGDTVSALYESYDIKDEMLHTNLGHVWVPIMLKVFHDSRSVKELVEHCRAQIAQVISEYPSNADNMVRRK
jgi:hypothetical protein